MVQLIVGEKGKGKTKHLLDKVNSAVKTASGNIVYLDKNSKHMYELRNAIRLIATSEYPISNTDEFMGFICGIVSQDHDIEEMYLDSFRIVAFIDDDNKIKAVLANSVGCKLKGPRSNQLWAFPAIFPFTRTKTNKRITPIE